VFCLNKNEEENFHHIIYKESRQENSHIFTATNSVITYPNNLKNVMFDSMKEERLNFDRFIKNYSLKAPLSETNLEIKVDGIVFNPLYQDFDFSYFLLIKTNIIDPLKKIGKEEKKYSLTIEEKGSKNNIKVLSSRCIIDLFSDYHKNTIQIDSDKSLYKKMRMAILFDDLIFQKSTEENFENITVTANKINLYLLRNLDKGANKLIFHNIQEKDFKSNAFLSIYGFVEVLYFETLFMKYNKNMKEKSLDLEFVNEVVEVSFCKDSIKCFKKFVDSIITTVSKLTEFVSDKTKEIKQNVKTGNQNKDENNELKNKFNLNMKENEDEFILENKSIDDHHFDVSHIQMENKDNSHELDIEYQKKFFLLFNFVKIFLYDGKDFEFEDVNIMINIRNTKKLIQMKQIMIMI
jgi:hypothetical protein